jgi:hypothetical protein
VPGALRWGKLLQNISTGQAKPDPVQPHALLREDLDSTTGTSPLCAPLRYPALYNGATDEVEPGDLTMLGQFALTTFGYDGTDLLERCHSSWHRWLYGQAIGSSQMVLWSDDYWVDPRSPSHGLLLHSLRRLNFLHPSPEPHSGNRGRGTHDLRGVREPYALGCQPS